MHNTEGPKLHAQHKPLVLVGSSKQRDLIETQKKPQFYNWLTNSQPRKSREELGTRLPHNCLVGCSYLARGGTNQILSLQTGLHSLPSFPPVMQEYWRPGRIEIPTETHQAGEVCCGSLLSHSLPWEQGI